MTTNYRRNWRAFSISLFRGQFLEANFHRQFQQSKFVIPACTCRFENVKTTINNDYKHSNRAIQSPNRQTTKETAYVIIDYVVAHGIWKAYLLKMNDAQQTPKFGLRSGFLCFPFSRKLKDRKVIFFFTLFPNIFK